MTTNIFVFIDLVAKDCQQDYGVEFGTRTQLAYWDILVDCYTRGDSVASTAFMCVCAVQHGISAQEQ